MFPFCIKVKVSLEKDEKVVNPPKNPVIKKSLIFWFDNICDANIVEIKPIRKEPTVLTRSVAYGKVALVKMRLIPYRPHAPIKPPNPT